MISCQNKECEKCQGFEYELDGCLKCHLREKLKEIKSLNKQIEALQKQVERMRNYKNCSNEHWTTHNGLEPRCWIVNKCPCDKWEAIKEVEDEKERCVL